MNDSKNIPSNQTTNSTVTTKKPLGKRRLAGLVLFCAVIALLFGSGGALIFEKYLRDAFIRWNILSNSDDHVVVREVQPVSVVRNDAVVDAVNKVNPAVVSIVVTEKAKDFLGQPITASGTGFILTADGLVATNKHVASDKNASYSVVTQSGKKYDGKVVDTDPLNDFAIIKIDAKDLPVVSLGFSDQLKLGETVIAIGNALGEYQNSVTTGVVSATNRSITAQGEDSASRLEGLIQVDAAINSGNSGGPLINLAGQVVGINTAVDVQAQNIGFAIPINDLRPAIDSVVKEGRIIRPMLGVRYVTITPEIAALNSLPVEQGALLASGNGGPALVAGGPAVKA